MCPKYIKSALCPYKLKEKGGNKKKKIDSKKHFLTDGRFYSMAGQMEYNKQLVGVILDVHYFCILTWKIIFTI